MVRTKDVPDIFFGKVVADETYFGGASKNKIKVIQDDGPLIGWETSKQLVFAILCWNGQVKAEIVDDSTLFPWISQKVELGSNAHSDI